MVKELAALLIVGGLITANLVVSSVTMMLGVFVAASPERAAKIWGSKRFDKLAAERKASFVSRYRVFGIFLFLGGVLFAVDSILFSSY